MTVPRARRFGVRFPNRRPHRRWGPPSLLFNEYRKTTSLRAKRPGRDCDHSPPSGDKVKNEWSYTSIPSMTSWREQGQFTFTYASRSVQYDIGPWPTARYSELRHMNRSRILQYDESTVSYNCASLFTGRRLFTVVCSHVTGGLYCGLSTICVSSALISAI